MFDGLERCSQSMGAVQEVADSSTGVIFTYLVRAHYSQRQPLLAGDQQCFVAALKLLVK